jgi:hypothetical protein
MYRKCVVTQYPFMYIGITINGDASRKLSQFPPPRRNSLPKFVRKFQTEIPRGATALVNSARGV